jgi:hypothetical protein
LLLAYIDPADGNSYEIRSRLPTPDNAVYHVEVTTVDDE